MSGSMVMYLTAYYCIRKSTHHGARTYWHLRLSQSRIGIALDWGW